MFSIIFIILSLMTGHILAKTFASKLYAAGDVLPKIMLRLPVAFTTGIVTAGLMTYACCMIFAATGRSMLYGSALSMLLMAAFIVFRRKTIAPDLNISISSLKLNKLMQTLKDAYGKHTFLCWFFAVLTVFFTWFFFYTFFYKDGAIAAGYTVFSDFGPHVAVIRSFSAGDNFPAQYPHYPDGTMRYHFMFHFIVGVLEFTGLRIDIAMNVFSLLCMLSCLSLLYVLAVRLTGKPAAGVLTIVLFIFRSSFAAFTYLFDGTQYSSVAEFFDKVINVPVFIGNTPHEDWGLWSNNVYANQRHLALGISFILIAILAYLPRVFEKEPEGETPGFPASRSLRLSWMPEDYKTAVFIGLLLGAAAYFHGSGVVAALGILAVMTVFSTRKLEYAITAVIAITLSVLQNRFFSTGAGPIKPEYQYGFLVSDPTWTNVVLYMIELTGIIFAIAVIGIILRRRSHSMQMFAAFLVPSVLTFTLSLTPDITVNHKFLMISVTLLNIYAAYAIIWIVGFFAEKRLKAIGIYIAAVLILLLTVSGIIDTFAYINRNGPERSARYADKSSQTVRWIRDNTPQRSVFASFWHVQSPVLLAGRFEFLGWPYFGWSAGYDTFERRDTLKDIFNTRDPQLLYNNLRENGISYTYIDKALLDDEEIAVDFDVLDTALTLVYRNEDENVWIYSINE